jgi:hypothetical protein
MAGSERIDRQQAANYGHTLGRNACPKGAVHPAYKKVVVAKSPAADS